MAEYTYAGYDLYEMDAYLSCFLFRFWEDNTMGFGPWEIMIGILILLLLFGASRIPKLARGLGEGVNEFKKGLKEGQEEEDHSNEKAEIPPEGEDETTPSDTG